MIKKIVKTYPKTESVTILPVKNVKTDEQVLREFVSKHGEKWVDQVLKNKI